MSDIGNAYSVTNGASAVNVKDFGAVGDGETDDTAAVQRALAYREAHGGYVMFPAGVYRCDTDALKAGGLR